MFEHNGIFVKGVSTLHIHDVQCSRGVPIQVSGMVLVQEAAGERVPMLEYKCQLSLAGVRNREFSVPIQGHRCMVCSTIIMLK